MVRAPSLNRNYCLRFTAAWSKCRKCKWKFVLEARNNHGLSSLIFLLLCVPCTILRMDLTLSELLPKENRTVKICKQFSSNGIDRIDPRYTRGLEEETVSMSSVAPTVSLLFPPRYITVHRVAYEAYGNAGITRPSASQFLFVNPTYLARDKLQGGCRG